MLITNFLIAGAGAVFGYLSYQNGYKEGFKEGVHDFKLLKQYAEIVKKEINYDGNRKVDKQ